MRMKLDNTRYNQGLTQEFLRTEVINVSTKVQEEHLLSIPLPTSTTDAENYPDNRIGLAGYDKDIFYRRPNCYIAIFNVRNTEDSLIAINYLKATTNDNQYGYDTESKIFTARWQRQNRDLCHPDWKTEVPKQQSQVTTWQIASDFFCAIFYVREIGTFHPMVK